MVYIKPISASQEKPLEEIRSSMTNRLLGHMGTDGIYLWERFTRVYYVFSWEEIHHAYEHYHLKQEPACIPD